MRHCRLRIMRMTLKPLIIAEPVGGVSNPRVVRRFLHPEVKAHDKIHESAGLKWLVG
jgi:hypothetical protein